MRAAAAGCGIGGFAGMGGCHDPNGLGEVAVDGVSIEWAEGFAGAEGFRGDRALRGSRVSHSRHRRLQQKHSPIQTLRRHSPTQRPNPVATAQTIAHFEKGGAAPAQARSPTTMTAPGDSLFAPKRQKQIPLAPLFQRGEQPLSWAARSTVKAELRQKRAGLKQATLAATFARPRPQRTPPQPNASRKPQRRRQCPSLNRHAGPYAFQRGATYTYPRRAGT